MERIDWDNLGFEITPAKKMFVSSYTDGHWDEGSILDYGPLSLYPSAVVLNYGQGVFEGMKAYRTRDGRIVIFRPFQNARRLNEGCRRLCMPEMDEERFVQTVERLVRENEDYIPPFGKGDLYIRPLLFGAGEMLGVRPATEYLFVIFMSPVGPYFKSGFRGIRLEIRDDFHRAPRHGTGGIKAIGNYATSLLPRKLVKERGLDEVLYLDAAAGKCIEEVGSSNFFLLKDRVVSTPRLSGSILPGITRDAVKQLTTDVLGFTMQERDIPWEEIHDADELFCTGTATVITPIVSVSYNGETTTVGSGEPGSATCRLYDELTQILLGQKPDKYSWIHEVK